MQVYKLFRVRKDGTIGSLFINKKERLSLNKWLDAKSYPTKGYKIRPFWHCMKEPFAPHLSMEGRKWFKVDMRNFKMFNRPKIQGGLWYLAQKIKIAAEETK
jgi:hypothetical protein